MRRSWPISPLGLDSRFRWLRLPAGISVAAETFPDGRLVQRRIAEMILAAAAVSVLMLTLGNYLAPIASRALQPEGREFVAEAVHMSLGQLGREARTAAERFPVGK